MLCPASVIWAAQETTHGHLAAPLDVHAEMLLMDVLPLELFRTQAQPPFRVTQERHEPLLNCQAAREEYETIRTAAVILRCLCLDESLGCSNVVPLVGGNDGEASMIGLLHDVVVGRPVCKTHVFQPLNTAPRTQRVEVLNVLIEEESKPGFGGVTLGHDRGL